MREHGTKTTPVFSPADGEASWSLFLSLVCTVQPETPIPPYRQSDRSGLRKPKNDKCKH